MLSSLASLFPFFLVIDFVGGHLWQLPLPRLPCCCVCWKETESNTHSRRRLLRTMVTVNPFFQSPFFSRQKLRATVTNDIWPAVLFFTLIATSTSFFASYCNDGIRWIYIRRSGSGRIGNDQHNTCHQQSDVDSTRHSVRFGHIVQNLDCLRKVRAPYLYRIYECIVTPLLLCAHRFSEARKLWTTISIASRTLAQIVRESTQADILF